MVGAELVWLGFPDGRLVDDFPTRLKFIELMMRVQPDLIITHPPEDYHSDHVATNQLVTKTVQMAWAPPVELKDQPGLAPLRKQVPVAFMTSASGINFIPEEYVDVSEVWDTKLQMVLSHRSQYMQGPDYDAVELKEPLEQYSFAHMARVMDEFYGLHCWCRYAEGFRWWKATDRLVARSLLP